MEKTVDSVAAEIAALKHSLREVAAAINKYADLAVQNVENKDVTASGSVSQSHKDLLLKTNNLLRTVRGPVDMVISHLENVSILTSSLDSDMKFAIYLQAVYTGCLRAVMEMGAFEALPTDGSSATATNLAETLSVEKDLLGEFSFNLHMNNLLICKTVRLMRNVTVLGPFAEVSKEKYAHTPYSQIFLVCGLQRFFKLMCV
jgi:hypothetical protein